jgi:hypothetical protein
MDGLRTVTRHGRDCHGTVAKIPVTQNEPLEIGYGKPPPQQKGVATAMVAMSSERRVLPRQFVAPVNCPAACG